MLTFSVHTLPTGPSYELAEAAVAPLSVSLQLPPLGRQIVTTTSVSNKISPHVLSETRTLQPTSSLISSRPSSPTLPRILPSLTQTSLLSPTRILTPSFLVYLPPSAGLPFQPCRTETGNSITKFRLSLYLPRLPLIFRQSLSIASSSSLTFPFMTTYSLAQCFIPPRSLIFHPHLPLQPQACRILLIFGLV